MLYLLHFDPPLRHAQHYLGYTTPERLGLRLRKHARGQGARIVRQALIAGRSVTLVRLWRDGTPTEERRIKNVSHLRTHCPVCQARTIAPDCQPYPPLAYDPLPKKSERSLKLWNL